MRPDAGVGRVVDPGKLPPTRNASTNTKSDPVRAVGRTLKTRTPNLRSGAAPHPRDLRTIESQAFGSRIRVV